MFNINDVIVDLRCEYEKQLASIEDEFGTDNLEEQKKYAVVYAMLVVMRGLESNENWDNFISEAHQEIIYYE